MSTKRMRSAVVRATQKGTEHDSWDSTWLCAFCYMRCTEKRTVVHILVEITESVLCVRHKLLDWISMYRLVLWARKQRIILRSDHTKKKNSV